MRVLAFCCLLVPNLLLAQNLPDELYLSPDGRMLLTGGQAHQGIYDESVIRTIHLDFDQPNFWTLMQQNYEDQIDIPATMTMDGIAYDSVGVRFKGQTSYLQTQNSEKKSFNISIDAFIGSQDVEGYETFNLNNCFQDPSFARELLYLHLIRNHVPAAKAAYVELFINGENWGLYPNVQGLNGEFIVEWFDSNNGSRWRADNGELPGGGGGGGGGGGPQWGDGTAALNFLSNDTSDYQEYYTLKKSDVENPWDDLVITCDKLENTPLNELMDTLPHYMDIDRTLWFLASEIAFSDDDSYVHKGKMDYYLYWEVETGRMVPLEYDGNSVMVDDHVNWSPFYNANEPNYPLLYRLLQIPELRQRYLAHLRTIIDESFDVNYINNWIDGMQPMIDPIVQADPKKLYSYNAFVSGLDEIEDFIADRKNVLESNSEVAEVGPEISNVETEVDGVIWQEPLENQPIDIRATVSSSSGISKVYLYTSNEIFGNFNKMEMFDDGQHNDGAAGDGIYGYQLAGMSTGTLTRFYVEAIANNNSLSASYDPPGAEHDVYFLQVVADVAAAPEVVINELMADNATTAFDENGQSEDWVELYNISGQFIDLSGYYLTDDPFNLNKWAFPSGSIMPPDTYLIVWCDEDGGQGPFHANFKLSSSGESVTLLDPDLVILDEVAFDQQVEDQGYARVPNGTGPFVIQDPTYGMNNETFIGVEEHSPGARISLFPNPANGQFTLELFGSQQEQVEIHNGLMQLVWSGQVQGRQTIDVTTWPAGMYMVQSGPTFQKLVVR